MAHQTHDLMTAFASDGAAWECLKVDGGMVANDWLAQDLADRLNLAVERPAFVETTALGTEMLAGVGCGMFSSLDEAVPMRGTVVLFVPRMAEALGRATCREGGCQYGWISVVAETLKKTKASEQ